MYTQKNKLLTLMYAYIFIHSHTSNNILSARDLVWTFLFFCFCIGSIINAKQHRQCRKPATSLALPWNWCSCSGNTPVNQRSKLRCNLFDQAISLSPNSWTKRQVRKLAQLQHPVPQWDVLCQCASPQTAVNECQTKNWCSVSNLKGLLWSMVLDRSLQSMVLDRSLQSMVLDRSLQSMVLDRSLQSMVLDRSLQSMVLDRSLQSMVLDRSLQSMVLDRSLQSMVLDRSLQSMVLDRSLQSMVLDRSLQSMVLDRSLQRQAASALTLRSLFNRWQQSDLYVVTFKTDSVK